MCVLTRSLHAVYVLNSVGRPVVGVVEAMAFVCSLSFTLILVFAHHLIVPKHYVVLDKCLGRFPAVFDETLTAADDVQTLGSGKLIKGCGRHIGSLILQRPRHTRFAKTRINLRS